MRHAYAVEVEWTGAGADGTRTYRSYTRDHVIRIDRDSLTLGYAGVYSSFLLFAKRASVKYGVPARDILVELGRRGMVGGQEDMIEDTAMTMARERGLTLAAA